MEELFNKIVQNIKELRDKCVKKFSDRTGFPGLTESDGTFDLVFEDFENLESWERESAHCIGDVLMARLYIEEEHFGDIDNDFLDEVKWVNNQVKEIMIENNLIREMDKHKWGL